MNKLDGSSVARRAVLVGVTLGLLLCSGTAIAQPGAIENELKRLKGHWRVVEMLEDGRAIPEDEMRRWLPGGGILEIVDYTILFQSPIDGAKSTKSFRLDPASYPKQIVIMERDATTGSGIYKFDQERLVLCISKEAGQMPSQFNAGAGSNRTLIVLERFDPGNSAIPAIVKPQPPRQPLTAAESIPAQQVSARAPSPPPALAAPPAQPAPPPIVADTVAGQVLTDSQVRSMVPGTWRMNDTEGSIDIVFDPAGGFQTYRYSRAITNFQVVFVPTPTSSGKWSVVNGTLVANVTSSTRIDRAGQTFVPAVRSISATDMILVDHFGRVTRAVKLR